jgi:hypothetical protein
MAVFEVVLVARVPALAGSPTLTVVDRLVTDSISYTDELNRPGSATLGCPIRSLSSAVTTRLANLAAFPSEAWIYVNSTLSWAGSVDSLGIQGQSLQINCTGLMGYLARMGVTADTTFAATDQFTIAKTLVNTWQSLSYGNYGIVTSGIGTSGITRDRTYLRADLKTVWAAVSELGAVLDGFDLWVNPSTRALTFAYPKRGTDLSASAVLDARTIDSASVVMSVTPDDLVTDVASTSSAQSTTGAQAALWSYRTNATLQAAFGRTFAGNSYDNVALQATLDGKGDSYLAARGSTMLQPGVTLVPNVATGTSIGAFGSGDTVAYAFDAGLGMQSGTYRVGKITVSVEGSGKQRMSVEFI